MVTLKAQASFIFKKNFGLGSLVLFIGLLLSRPIHLSVVTMLIISLIGGYVIGLCFKLMVQNTMFSSINFYEHMVKFRLESGRFTYWKYRLIQRLLLTAFCLILALSVLCLPLCLQWSQHSISLLYVGLIFFLYIRIGRFITVQLRAWKLIKARSVEVEALIEHQ